MPKASKTNVSARQEAKGKVHTCKHCKKPINIVMSLTGTGRKKMIRKCCGEQVTF